MTNNNEIPVMNGKDVLKYLSENGRMYFSGHLEYEQPGIKHYDAVEVEIGESFYTTSHADKPHLHTWNTELNFIIEGRVKVLFLSTGQEFEFLPGSMYVVEPNTPYITKGDKGAKVIFVKIPGGNDKQVISQDELPENIDLWKQSYNTPWTNK